VLIVSGGDQSSGGALERIFAGGDIGEFKTACVGGHHGGALFAVIGVEDGDASARDGVKGLGVDDGAGNAERVGRGGGRAGLGGGGEEDGQQGQRCCFSWAYGGQKGPPSGFRHQTTPGRSAGPRNKLRTGWRRATGEFDSEHWLVLPLAYMEAYGFLSAGPQADEHALEFISAHGFRVQELETVIGTLESQHPVVAWGKFG